MKKKDIAISYHNGTRGKPMINVKSYGQFRLKPEFGAYPDTRFGSWIEDLEAKNRDILYDYWYDACNMGFYGAKYAAKEIFGQEIECYQQGRSGGWFVVEGLPDVETWDALMVSKWAKLVKEVDRIVEGLPELTRDLLYHNAFANWVDLAYPVVPRAEGT